MERTKEAIALCREVQGMPPKGLELIAEGRFEPLAVGNEIALNRGSATIPQ